MEEIKTEEQMKEIQDAITYYQVYAIIAVVATIFGFGMVVERCLTFLTTMGF